MIQSGGWFLPDGESHLQRFLEDSKTRHFARGTYQRKKYLAALAHVKNYTAVIDVGAHVGLWSWQFAQHFNQIFAFEPIAAHRECWHENMKGLESRARPIPLACAERGREGESVFMATDPTSSGDSYPAPREGDGNAGEAMLTSIDKFMEDKPSWPPGLIKFDCEGYELFALLGAENTIREHGPVLVIEQKPGKAQKYGLTETAAITTAQAWGYRTAKIMSGDYIMVRD